MKKKLVSLLQMALGLGIILFILLRMQGRGDLGKLLDAIRDAAGNWQYLAVGALIFGCCINLCVTRWYVILRAQGLVLPFRRLLTLYFVGHFFNAFMFGATGGDVVKAYYVATETKHKRTEVVSTVFIDRALGLLSLVLLTVVMMLCRLPFFLSQPQMRVAIVFNVLLLSASVVGLAVVFRQNLFERWELFRRLERKTAMGQIISRAYNAFRICLQRPSLLVRTTILSLLNQVFLVTCTFYLGISLGLDLKFVSYLTVFPIINAVSAIPITPGGLGTRETAAIYLLGAFGVPDTTAVVLALLLYATVLLWSLAGGVVYVFYSYVRGTLPPTTVVDLDAERAHGHDLNTPTRDTGSGQ